MVSTTLEEEQQAKEGAKAARKATTKKHGKMSFKSRMLLIIVSLFLMAFLRTGFMFVIIALLPSVVAYYIDTNAERYAFRTIFACNLSGTLPYLGKMFEAGPSSALLQHLMSNAGTWIIIYGTALIGWLMVEICPIIAQVMIVTTNQSQIARIERLQKKIEGEWGPEVTLLAVQPQDEDDM